MPSPIGHFIGGVAAGWLIAGRPAAAPRVPPSLWPSVLLFGVLGVAPDFDFLMPFGGHRTWTHSLTAVAGVGLVAWLLMRMRRPGLALACAAAFGSHLLFDWLGQDTKHPVGIMVFWPFSTEFFQSSLHLFPAVSRRFGTPEFFAQNTVAFLFEVLLLVPLLMAVAWLRRDRSARTRSAARRRVTAPERSAPPFGEWSPD